MISLNLNLLLVFEALYDLRSATKAARRLSVTQSAVSHALRRLRAASGDPLLVTSSGQRFPGRCTNRPRIAIVGRFDRGLSDRTAGLARERA